ANQTAYTISGKKKKYEDVVLDNNSIKVDPKEDAYNSTDDPDKAKEESQKGKYDFNITVITDYLNNNSNPGGSIVNRKIKAVIPQVYSTLFATGVARQTTEYLDRTQDMRKVTVLGTGANLTAWRRLERFQKIRMFQETCMVKHGNSHGRETMSGG
ncbi:MAG: hypothetical protein QSU88_09440, partial [Candidatus Methanoperedens sp.]|nr:hypothetical protein [Candidatus Methanoperedens sp.]